MVELCWVYSLSCCNIKAVQRPIVSLNMMFWMFDAVVDLQDSVCYWSSMCLPLGRSATLTTEVLILVIQLIADTKWCRFDKGMKDDRDAMFSGNQVCGTTGTNSNQHFSGLSLSSCPGQQRISGMPNLKHSLTGWWFQIFFIFTPIWGRFPFWLVFFKGVETTNYS